MSIVVPFIVAWPESVAEETGSFDYSLASWCANANIVYRWLVGFLPKRKNTMNDSVQKKKVCEEIL